MSDFAEWTKLLKLKTSRDVDAAARYLEGKGQRFLVDFGTETAVEKATDICLQVLEVMQDA